MSRDPEIPVPRQRKETQSKSTTKTKPLKESKDEDFIEDPSSSQAKKLLQMEVLSDSTGEQMKSEKILKKKLAPKRKSSSQMNSKKK